MNFFYRDPVKLSLAQEENVAERGFLRRLLPLSQNPYFFQANGQREEQIIIFFIVLFTLR